jgi:hypothetical protein
MEGRYLYCIADIGEEIPLGINGLDGREVYTVPFDGVAAVVHDAGEPYGIKDQGRIIDLAVKHQEVVEEAWRKFGTVLPVRFNTIIKGDTDGLRGWIKGMYKELQGKIERLREMEEYGVQVFMDRDLVGERLMETVPALTDLRARVGSGRGGTAYMHQQMLERELEREMRAEADIRFRELYPRIKRVSEEVSIENLGTVPDLPAERSRAVESGLSPKQRHGTKERVAMFMNLSCLVSRGRYMDLVEELESIDRMVAFSVRFTGPWPPYSFVGFLGDSMKIRQASLPLRA